MADFDSYDRNILTVLQQDGRVTNAELAERVGLSPSPCWRRVRQLEEAGVIRGYVALLDPAKVGLGLSVFVQISLNLHHAEAFETTVCQRREVVECYAMTGEQDYLLHVVVPDMVTFDLFVRDALIHMPGVERIRSSFTLKVIKATTALPLERR